MQKKNKHSLKIDTNKKKTTTLVAVLANDCNEEEEEAQLNSIFEISSSSSPLCPFEIIFNIYLLVEQVKKVKNPIMQQEEKSTRNTPSRII
jgi:hypothetical protein